MPKDIITVSYIEGDGNKDEVNYEAEDYRNNCEVWSKCRTIYKGGDAVQEAGEKFLPKLIDMELTAYENYKKRALFYNATKRTVDGLVGALFQKDTYLSFPTNKKDLEERQEEIDDFFDNISLQKLPFNLLLKDICREVIIVGRIGILVDAQVEGVSEEKIYLTQYTAESIINWHSEIIDGCPTLTLVVLKEIVKQLTGRFKPCYKTQYRVLRLVPSMEDERKWVYHNFVYQEMLDKGKKIYVLLEHNIPTMKGATFDRIPFYFINGEGTSPEIHPSPINDLVNVNISHYRSSADLEHGRHFTCLLYTSPSPRDS